jgi:hypothetical protein
MNASVKSEKTDKPAGAFASHDSHTIISNDIRQINEKAGSLSLRLIGNLSSDGALDLGVCEKITEIVTKNN